MEDMGGTCLGISPGASKTGGNGQGEENRIPTEVGKWDRIYGFKSFSEVKPTRQPTLLYLTLLSHLPPSSSPTSLVTTTL